MPEAEELIIDGLRHAGEALGRLWQRHRPPPSPGPTVHLSDVKRRLELLIESVLGYPLPVRPAQCCAPVPLARRWFDPGSRSAAPPGPLPANDGTAIYLPPSLPVPDDAGRIGRGIAGPDEYSLLALLQALRCARGSALHLAAVDSGMVMDLYLLAECVAADHGVRRLMPGWCDGLAALRARTAVNLEKHRPRTRQAAEVAARYGVFLLGNGVSPPVARTPAGALEWARSAALEIAGRFPHERYVPWLGDCLIGRLLRPEGKPSRSGRNGAWDADQEAEHRGHPRSTALSRRPRASDADHEDDPSPGVWMIQSAEPTPHAEDPLGLNRPEDRDADDDPQGSAESVAEMAEARLVH
ncbi:MAG TPA: hypothetical protein VK165_16745, partial [Azonexus sp.]|nr:hypothetical protein [Azonexus sp.]